MGSNPKLGLGLMISDVRFRVRPLHTPPFLTKKFLNAPRTHPFKTSDFPKASPQPIKDLPSNPPINKRFLEKEPLVNGRVEERPLRAFSLNPKFFLQKKKLNHQYSHLC